jgi:adenylate kinase
LRKERSRIRSLNVLALLCSLLFSSFLEARAPVRVFVLVGAPASSKGTVARLLKAKYNVPHVSTGDLVRAEIKAGSEFGKKVADMTERGELLPDTPEFVGEMLELLRRRLLQDDCKNGFILDGVPRTLFQTAELQKLLAELGHTIDHTIGLEIDDKEVVRRMAGRLTCKDCGATYHITDRPPKSEGHCDHCKGELYRRPDDAPEPVMQRLKIYHAEAQPIVRFYRQEGVMISVDANRDSARVFEEIVKSIDEHEGRAPFYRNYLRRRIPRFPHHSIPGFEVYNLTEMYKDPELLRYINREFLKVIEELKPDYIAAPEARALPIFGSLLVSSGKPGIFIRKSGKLPRNAPKHGTSYTTAYSTDGIELSQDENLRGKTVIIIDDGISSGGTTLATVKLLEEAGMKVIWILGVVQYHYRDLCSDFLSYGLAEKTQTLFDL